MRLYEYTVHELHEMLMKKEVSSCEITTDVVNRIDEVESQVGSFVTLDIDDALKQAKRCDNSLNSLDAAGLKDGISPLFGIPMALKDNMCSYGTLTACCSKMLENYFPPYDATVVTSLRKNEAVILGKTNMDEFAMGSSTETSHFKLTRNPWDLKRVPGGSSGGSAACVSAGEAIYSLGTDTGGSVRQPASLCCTVGMKPTYGSISRYGVIAFASSLDQVGPITRDVRDAALVLNALSHHDPKDATSSRIERDDFTSKLGRSIAGTRIGVPKECFGNELDFSVRELMDKSIGMLSDMGAVIVPVSLPYLDYIMEIYYVLSSSEVSSNLARFDGLRFGHSPKEFKNSADYIMRSRTEGFGKEVKRRLIMGSYFLSKGAYDKYYDRTMKVRTLVNNSVSDVLEKCDAFVSPTTICPAFEFGEKIKDPIAMYKSDSYTTISNITGIPSISVPCGFADGLPVGIQFLAKHHDEANLLGISYAFEKECKIHNRLPGLGR